MTKKTQGNTHGLYFKKLFFLLCVFTLLFPVIEVSASNSSSNNYNLENQQSEIRGKIVDSKSNEPVIGANVMVKGTTVGTITDLDGNFSLKANNGQVLVISYIGYKTLEYKVKSNNFTIKITEDSQSLEEVIVVGYSSQKRESLTGSMQTLKEDKLKDVTTPSVENMLNGKAPGVYVSPGTGQPGQAGSIIIRGKSTINGSTDPLWVIDGVIVGSNSGNLNPADIETLTVLKDAASTAIYGSQGANGVILVTTKAAKSQKMTINASVKLGITRLDKGNMNVMNGEELYDYYKSFDNADQIAFPRWNEDLRKSDFNWWDFASQTGFAQDYNVSLNGGNEKLSSFFSAGVYDEEGAVKGYDYTKYSIRYKSIYRPYKWLKIKPSFSGSKKDVDDRQHAVGAMYLNLPWDRPIDKDGNVIPHYSDKWVNSNSTNYYFDLQYNHSSTETYDFLGNIDFDVEITDWLTFSSVNSYKWQTRFSDSYSDPESSAASGVNGRQYEYSYRYSRRYTNQILRFNKLFDKHSVSALAAYEFNDFFSKSVTAQGVGMVRGYEVLDNAIKPEKVAGGISEWAVQSYLFNGNYAYDNRYLAQLSLRRDGASNFGTKNKYGNFFSISGGWNIYRESWFNVKAIDYMKLRASYGSVGNRPNSLYPQYDLYAINQKYNEKSGALISQIGNEELTWEKTYTTGVGLDLNMFNCLRMTFDYYQKRTSNLLYRVPVTGLIGVTGIWRNIGELKNTGFEFTMGIDLLKTKDLNWTFDANLGLNRNEVVSLYGDRAQIIVGDGSGISGSANKMLRPGLDSDSWYLREWAGVDKANGSPLWFKTDKDGNRVTTSNYAEADQVICGSYTPDFFGGFSTSLTYKGFDLNAVFGYSVGGDIYNYSRAEFDSDGAYTDRNQMTLQDGWSRWEKPDDVATHPKPSYNNSSNSNKSSSRFLEDASYLKLRNLTLGYNLSLPQYQIKNVRLFLTGENLFCITDYSGVDPEIPPKDGVVTGVATTIYPQTRKFMFGLNLTF